jgi:SAM-dependent methyltransferase
MDLVELAKQNIISRHPWETVRIKIVAEKISNLLSQELSGKNAIRVLDVGSGDAYVIDQLATQFPNVHFVAVDTYYDQDIIEDLQKGFVNKDKIELFGSWESFEQKGYEIDLVLLLDVIEHVPDDVAFMKMIGEKIKNPFHFIITVPAFQKLFTQHDVFLKHYRRYHNSMLKSNVNLAGWTPREVGYFYIIALLMRTMGKIKEKFLGAKVSDKGISEWKKSEGVTKLANTVLWLDYKFASFFRMMGIKLPGLSNYCIGHRK